MHVLSQLITVKTALILAIILSFNPMIKLYGQERPVADFSFDGKCAGAPVRFQDLTQTLKGESLTWWWWDFGDQRHGELSYAYKPNPEHTYQKPGIYNVRLIVGNQSGMRDTVDHQLEIIPRPEAPMMKDSVICFNNILDMLSQSRDANHLRWYRDMESLTPILSEDGTIITDMSYSDTLFLEAVSPQSCRSERVAAPVTMLTKEAAEIVVKSDTQAIPETEVTFTISTSYDITAWLWDFGDSDSAHVPQPTHTYTIPGLYEASVIITNKEGCQLKLEKEIRIKNPSSVQFPSAFSPNGDGFNDTFEIETGDLQAFLIRIFNQEGSLVFESSDKYFAWDGWGIDGKLQSEGVYSFVITGTDTSGSSVEEQHRFTLIR